MSKHDQNMSCSIMPDYRTCNRVTGPLIGNIRYIVTVHVKSEVSMVKISLNLIYFRKKMFSIDKLQYILRKIEKYLILNEKTI